MNVFAAQLAEMLYAPPVEGDDLQIVFGGAFDPPHLGHWELAEAARRWAEERSGGRVDVIWTVAIQPYHKPTDRRVQHYDTRIREKLVTQLLAQQGGLWHQGGRHRLLSNDELAAGWEKMGRDPISWWAQPTYTIDTLAAAQALDEIGENPWLLVGADAAGGLADWHRWGELKQQANILVGRRVGEDDPRRPDDLDPGRWRVLARSVRAESSTRIRRLIEEEAWEEVEQACGPKVAKKLRRLSERTAGENKAA